MNKNIILTIATILVFGSCQKIIDDFKIDEKPKKIVMNGMITSDSLFAVQISRSLSILEHDTIVFLPDAEVRVIENNQNIYDLEYTEKGIFKSLSLYPKEGHSYKIMARGSGLEPINAYTTIPVKPEIISIDTSVIKDLSEPDCYGCAPEDFFEISLKFKEPRNTEDYYMISTYATFKRYIGYDTVINYPWGESYDLVITDTVYYKSKIYMKTNENIVEIEGEEYPYLVTPDYFPSSTVFYFSDKNITTDTYDFSIQISPYEIPFSSSPELEVHLVRIHKDYFEFMLSRAKAEEVFENPLAEKVTIYNNIENGLGHLYSYNTAAFKVDASSAEDTSVAYY